MSFEQLTVLPDGAVLKRRNRSYTRLMQAVMAAAGKWVAVPFSEINGATPSAKKMTLEFAAAHRKMAIEIAVGEDRLYVRLTPATEVAHD
jgi:hypothetical protein